MSESLIVAASHVERIVSAVGLDPLMDEVIAGIEAELVNYDPHRFESPRRTGFQYCNPHEGLIEWMPIFEHSGRVTLKVVGYHPSNPDRTHLPTILSTISLYDSHTGHLEALIDGTLLTALRTGAASAVATRLLANPESRIVGLVGCGVQAITQLHAMTRVLDVSTVLISDASPDRLRSFESRIDAFAPEGLAIEEVSIDEAFGRSDVLCTSTSAPFDSGPLFEDQQCKPWLHVNAVGSDFPGKYELPISFLRRSDVYPDFREQAEREGECQRLDPHEIGMSLHELVKNRESARRSRGKTTVFDSTGWALTDHVAASVFLAHAREIGAFTPIAVESVSRDPYAPYGSAVPVGADTSAGTKVNLDLGI